jgi:hypothetical protein
LPTGKRTDCVKELPLTWEKFNAAETTIGDSPVVNHSFAIAGMLMRKQEIVRPARQNTNRMNGRFVSLLGFTHARIYENPDPKDDN